MITFRDYLFNLKTEIMRKEIKQEQLAEKTGLSLTTVNLLLNGKTLSKQILKIEEAIKEWN